MTRAIILIVSVILIQMAASGTLIKVLDAAYQGATKK